MSQNEERINQFMDALGEIDPKYVEEAGQAFSPESCKEHIFSIDRLSASMCRWILFPFVRLATAACLLLIIVIGVKKGGIFPDFPFLSKSGSSGSSSFDVNDSEGTHIENELIDLPDDSDTDENTFPQNNVSDNSEKSAAESKTDKFAKEDTGHSNSANSEGALSQRNDESEKRTPAAEPPVLTLYTSNLSEPAVENADALSITGSDYSWSYSKNEESYGKEEGIRSSSHGQSSDQWTLASLTTLSLTPGSMITPDFNDIEPDSYTVRCIPASKAHKVNSEKDYLDIEAEGNGSFQLPEEENSYIVELYAVWDNKTYEGNCTYHFKVNFQE